MRVVLATAAVAIGAGVAAAIAGTSAWDRASAATVDKLRSSPAAAASTYRASALESLPPPVERFFRAVLKDGQPVVRSAIATQEAEFFINGSWRPLRATQHFTTSPPGFVWDARIGMAPLITASVRDAYVAGSGMMQASMFGLYTLADQVGTPDLNAGALQRYLGEAVWFPTALLPSPTVTWLPVNDRSATVTLRDGAAVVSLDFAFNDRGLATRIIGDRYKEDGGVYTLQPWQIECDEHADRDGMIIPQRCEVSWINDGTAEPYWRGRITSIAYRFN
jgi:hypothetical protein